MRVHLIEKISLWQLFILIYVFELGSAIVIGLGNEAKQDAWLAVFLSTLIGILITFFYWYLLTRKPGKNLFEIIEFCLGKLFSKVIIMGYIFYFFYIASRVLRDFGELIVSSIFVLTPTEIISLTMILVIAYIVYLGLEVLSRTSEIFLPYLVVFILLVGIFILFSGEMQFANFRPVLAEGFSPIIDAMFPTLLTFPFGEMIVFTLIIPYVTRFEYAGKVSMIAVFLSGLFLMYASMVEIATLGAEMKGRSNFPLLSAAREISLLDFIERVDLVIVFVVMFGIIVKVSVFFFGGLKGLELVFNRPYRLFILPMSTIIGLISITVSDNFAEHIEEGLVLVPYLFHIPFQFVIPAVILVILLFKNRKVQKRRKNDVQFKNTI
ncbi:endospore germination permease [Cytobacillus sp. S13-E01]|uniref:GerAB/ArcD/ProY family transporter n=1 Tax=Cytobacillus sp. S13-E01 TaxID=3031326 RepID=UPI0023D828A3|nr:endospore germination permease [Cytobacillus sp. S13-E01]MDF0725686.1 endospore germination permease [Cytobacillus sp. S13-E01]